MPINAVDWQPEDPLILSKFQNMNSDLVNVSNNIHPQYSKLSPPFIDVERYLKEGTPGDAYNKITWGSDITAPVEQDDAAPSSSSTWQEIAGLRVSRGLWNKLKVSCKIIADNNGSITNNDIFFRIQLFKRTWADPSTDTLLTTSDEINASDSGPGTITYGTLEIISGDLSALDSKDFILISFQSKTDSMGAGDESWATFTNILYNWEEV